MYVLCICVANLIAPPLLRLSYTIIYVSWNWKVPPSILIYP
jgi:hypothetical protein